MSMPGWYPDPSGVPNQYRYWDGAAWSQHTTSDPRNGSSRRGSSGGGRGPLIAITVIALVVVIALTVFVIARGTTTEKATEDENSSAPTISAWDETTTPTPSPSPTPSDPAPSGGDWTSCPTGMSLPREWTGGNLRGGDLEMTPIDGWSDGSSSFVLGWVGDMQAQTDTVATVPSITTWFSAVAVGAVSVANGFEAARPGAEMAMDCFATSQYYSGFAGRKDISSTEVTIDGAKGWWIRAEVYVDMPLLPNITGDVIDVVMVDTGDPESLSMFISSYTIGDTARERKVDAARESLHVVR